jgi:GGDEF domain-containing protein
MHPPAPIHEPIAGDELERLWGALAAAPVATAVVGPDGRPRYLVRQLVDLREGRRPEDQLAWRATHDALTGLPNRSLFLDRLEMTLARLGREPALAAVLVLDLDRFREVAERVGDAVDRLLVAVTGRLRSILRPSDTVSRFGSDEFAVLCPTWSTGATPSAWPSGSPPGWPRRSRSAVRRSWSRPASASPSPGRAPAGPRRCCRTPTRPWRGPSSAAAASTSCSTRRSGPS